MYVSSSSIVVLPRIRLDFLPVDISSVSFYPFQSFSAIVCVRGERVLVLSEVHVVIDGDIFCGGLNIDGYVIDFIFCVGVQFPCVFLCAVGAHGANDSAGPVIQNTAMDVWGNFGRYVYQLVEKPGWVSIPPSLVVLFPFGLYLSPVSQGCWWPLRRQIPFLPAI